MFGVATRVLVRWERGLVSVGGGGKEVYLEAAGCTSEEDARTLGKELLKAYKGSRGTVSVTGHVHTPGQSPGSSYYVGDRMNGMVVQSIAIGMDGEGQVTVTPELGDPLRRRLDALQRRVAKSAGTASEFGSPFPPRGVDASSDDRPPPVFGYEWRPSDGGSGGVAS